MMRKVHTVVALVIAVAGCASAQSRPAARQPVSISSGTPFARGEVLNYNVNWPSGLSLGEASLKAGSGEPGWDFEFSLDASLPAFEIKDHYKSSADGALCSTRLEKDSTHGSRKAKETVKYDQQKHEAVRETASGGKSEFSIAECAKDALTFLYFLRRELASGRVPQAQAVNFGATYQVTTTYGNSQQIEIAGERQQADRVQVSFRGPASNQTFEIFFARDAARTPLVIRVPFSLGSFALELVK